MIELCHVTYSVRTPEGHSRVIVDDVCFTVEPESISCIMGTSGSGKTTLLRLIAGLLAPDSGEVRLCGHNIVGLPERELNVIRRDMGFVFQYSALFDSMTIAENVGFGLERMKRPRQEIQDTVTRLLSEVGLPDLHERLPSELSGGQRKRAAMARALATSPKVVLYDEPASGLDPIMTRVIDDLIVELRDREKTTNLVVSHNVPSIMRISDQVVMLFEGKIVANGHPREVEKSTHPAVRQFLEGRADGPIEIH